MDHYTFKQKSPSDHIAEVLGQGQRRTRAMLKQLPDNALLELADVLQEFIPSAKERQDAKEAKAKLTRDWLYVLRTEFDEPVEETLKKMIEITKPKKRKYSKRKEVH
ncbi:hypothetical protein VCR15J2_390053 [Vibrio coralliirubri]|uniref:hypothetical protein n=1 Tax=Vibrio coralliirubri TaxID=1516159 RepID=UPI0006318DCB|nr:hypothetical protein [Vibrio coralliirubri]CDT53273.1 hypothetical protein VCR15J2_390053 [Vibrio coralliirubri]